MEINQLHLKWCRYLSNRLNHYNRNNFEKLIFPCTELYHYYLPDGLYALSTRFEPQINIAFIPIICEYSQEEKRSLRNRERIWYRLQRIRQALECAPISTNIRLHANFIRNTPALMLPSNGLPP